MLQNYDKMAFEHFDVKMSAASAMGGRLQNDNNQSDQIRQIFAHWVTVYLG
jgi:hypothetical protein